MKVDRTIRSCAAALLVLGCATGAGAADGEARPAAIGATTEAILKMQREGSAAGQPQPMSGEVASRSYKRYLDSFNRPMPAESASTNAGGARPATATTAGNSR